MLSFATHPLVAIFLIFTQYKSYVVPPTPGRSGITTRDIITNRDTTNRDTTNRDTTTAEIRRHKQDSVSRNDGFEDIYRHPSSLVCFSCPL